MKPTKPFEETPEGLRELIIAKDQPEYLPLPAVVTQSGDVLTCWELSKGEVNQIRRSGKLYLSCMTFGNPLQPLCPTAFRPSVTRGADGATELDYAPPSEAVLRSETPAETIWTESIYGAETKQGLVAVTIGNESRTISPTDARAVAYALLECADAAESDEFIMEWLKQAGVEDLQKRFFVLQDFRGMREKMRQR